MIFMIPTIAKSVNLFMAEFIIISKYFLLLSVDSPILLPNEHTILFDILEDYNTT